MAVSYVLNSDVDITFKDHSGEISRTSFHVVPLLADGSNRAALLTAVQNMYTGIAALTLCNMGGGSVSLYKIHNTLTTPANENAQREIKVWVQYVDSVNGKFYSQTIPGPDLTLIAQINTDEVDIVSNVVAAAYVAIFEANVKSELNNAVVVTRMRIIRGAR